jgi:hypothetical protein
MNERRDEHESEDAGGNAVAFCLGAKAGVYLRTLSKRTRLPKKPGQLSRQLKTGSLGGEQAGTPKRRCDTRQQTRSTQLPRNVTSQPLGLTANLHFAMTISI